MSLLVTLVERVVHIVSNVINDALVSELGVGDAGPFSTTVPHTRAPHHVAQVMLLIPLIPNAIHDPFIGCADLLVGSHWAESKLLIGIVVLGGAAPFHVVPATLRSTVGVIPVVVQEGEVAQSTIGISASSLNQNRMVCAEGILLVLFVIGSCATPQMSVLPPFGGAGIEGPTVVGEREDTGLPV